MVVDLPVLGKSPRWHVYLTEKTTSFGKKKRAIFIKTNFCTFSNGDNLQTHDKELRVFGIDCWNENKLMLHVYVWMPLIMFRWNTWTIFVPYNNNNFVLLEGIVLCLLSSEVSASSLCRQSSLLPFVQKKVWTDEMATVWNLCSQMQILLKVGTLKKVFVYILKSVKNLRQPESLTLYP